MIRHFRHVISVATATSFATTSTFAQNDDEPTWAHPHPYDGTTPKSRFAPLNDFTTSQPQYDLHKLVTFWQTNPSNEETWPWLWCQHNPTGPHHVFINVDSTTLTTCESLAAASPNNNITLVVPNIKTLDDPAPYYKARVAIIESSPTQIDFSNRILLLRDERIVCYDSLTVTT